MTYQELWANMTNRERIACRIMCYMKVSDEGSWTVCLRNKILSKIAGWVIKKNVFDWEIELGEMLEPELYDGELDDIRTEMAALKLALK